MTKVKVVKDFRCKDSGKIYLVGEVVDFTADRIKELKSASKEYGFDFVEDLEVPKKSSKKTVKEVIETDETV